MPDQYPNHGGPSFSTEDAGGQYCYYITEEPSSSDDKDQPFFEGDTMTNYQHQSPPYDEGGPSFTGVDGRQHSEDNAGTINSGAGEPSQYPEDVRMNWWTPAPGCNPSFSRRVEEGDCVEDEPIWHEPVEHKPLDHEPVEHKPEEDFYPLINTETDPMNAHRLLESGREVHNPPNPEHYHHVEGPEPAQSNKSSRRPKHYGSRAKWDDERKANLIKQRALGKSWEDIEKAIGIEANKCSSKYNHMYNKKLGENLAWQLLNLGQRSITPGQTHVSSQVHEDAARGDFLPMPGDSPYVFYVHVKSHVKGACVDWKTPGLIPWACERASAIHAQLHDGSWQLAWNTVAGLINIINKTDTSGPAVAVRCGYKSTTGPGEAEPATEDYGEPHADVEDDSEADA